MGTELLVWYEDIYPQYFGIPISIHDLNSMGESEFIAVVISTDIARWVSIFERGLSRRFQLRTIF